MSKLLQGFLACKTIFVLPYMLCHKTQVNDDCAKFPEKGFVNMGVETFEEEEGFIEEDLNKGGWK